MTDPTASSSVPRGDSRAVLARNWRWLMALGILWIVLGAMAIVLPVVAAVALDVSLGVLLLVGGVVQAVQAVRSRGWSSVIPHALGGIIAGVAGLLLLFFPLEGAITLGLVLGVFFVVGGVFRLVAAVQNRRFRGWTWVALSAVASIALGVIIWLGWPGSALWILGLLVGIELIFSGWAMIMLASSARPT